MNEKIQAPVITRAPRSVTWLALSLSLAYFALMATLMWMFENALGLGELQAAVENPHRLNVWLLIAITALVIFSIAQWTLGRMSHANHNPTVDQGALDAQQEAALPVAAWQSWRDALILVGAVGIILAGTAGYMVSQQEELLDRARYRHFSLIGKLKADSVARWVDERQRDLNVLLENERFKVDLARWMDSADGNRTLQDTLRAQIDAVLQANAMDGLTVIDAEGRLRLSVPDDLRARTQCRAVAAAQPTDSTAQTKLSRAFEDALGDAKLDLIGTAYATINQDPTPVATLCMRVDLNRRLLPMVSKWPGAARSGELLLARPDGADMVILNDPDPASDGWRIRREAGARAAWEAALQSTTQDKELIERVNTQERDKLLAIYPVAGTPWLLQVRMDADEANQLQSRNQRYATVIIGFVLLFVVVAFAIVWARTRRSGEGVELERDALLTQLHELAYYDELTGLPSRRLINDRLEVALMEAERRNEKVGVFFIDLDRFKAVNDTYGHEAGDLVLKTVAQRLQACVRKNDSVGRLSGDEYLVILTGNPDADTLVGLQQKIMASVQQTIPWKDVGVHIGLSIGQAVYPDDGINSQELTSAADKAMYIVKQRRRDA